jgi:CBS domain-containing protein
MGKNSTSERIRKRAEHAFDRGRRRFREVSLPDVQIDLPRIQVARRRRRRSMFGLLLNRFTVGFGVGYVLGTRAGRERYRQIVGVWDSLMGNPQVREVVERGKEMAAATARSRRWETVGEVMTADPISVRPGTSLAEVARLMRDADTGAMVVTDDAGRLTGLVTDRDIAVRAVAEGRDITTATVGDIATGDLATLAPSDTVDHAVRLMRQRAVRRLPVVENERPVGVVSIGDLAVERDADSALADISSAPPPRR